MHIIYLVTKFGSEEEESTVSMKMIHGRQLLEGGELLETLVISGVGGQKLSKLGKRVLALIVETCC